MNPPERIPHLILSSPADDRLRAIDAGRGYLIGDFSGDDPGFPRLLGLAGAIYISGDGADGARALLSLPDPEAARICSPSLSAFGLATLEDIEGIGRVQRAHGGWRRASPLDVAWARCVLASSGPMGPEAGRSLLEHPIWPYVEFLRPLDLAPFVRIVAWMGDPRWWGYARSRGASGEFQLVRGRNAALRSRFQVRPGSQSPAFAAVREAIVQVDLPTLRRRGVFSKGARWLLAYLSYAWEDAYYAKTQGAATGAFFIPEKIFGHEPTSKSFRRHFRTSVGRPFGR